MTPLIAIPDNEIKSHYTAVQASLAENGRREMKGKIRLRPIGLVQASTFFDIAKKGVASLYCW
jgi:hypothetical protein